MRKIVLTSCLLLGLIGLAQAAHCPSLLPEYQLSQIQLGEIHVPNQKILPGVMCVYHLPNDQQQKLYRFTKGYFYTVDNAKSLWHEAKTNRFRYCTPNAVVSPAKPPVRYQPVHNQCLFKELINWP